jgi:hypothetical protein
MLHKIAKQHRNGNPVPFQTRADRAWNALQLEPSREAMAGKMETPEGKAVYNQRMHIAETPYAIIKSILGERPQRRNYRRESQFDLSRWFADMYPLRPALTVVIATKGH